MSHLISLADSNSRAKRLMFNIVLILSYLLIKLYKSVALNYNIIDNPNRRSSHQIPTIRGAGIIFPIMFIFLLLNEYSATTSYFQYNLFLIVALILSSTISFIDDIYPQSIIIRSVIYLISLFLIIYSINLQEVFTTFDTTFGYFSAYILFIIFLFGILNSYNFMDGINGILTSNSIINVSSLAISYHIYSSSHDTIFYYFLPTLIVFGYYNFRKKAHFFAGDIGSISIAIILIIGVFQIISITHNYHYFLFFTTFIIDSWTTIIFRLIRQEPLHKPHKSHLYQYLFNDLNFPFWKVSIIYGIPQILINLFVILDQGTISIILSILTLFFYLSYRIRKQGTNKLLNCYDPELFPKKHKSSPEITFENNEAGSILKGEI